jgi:hypothetical protein
MDTQEYIIINKTAIQKRIEDLEKEYNQEPEEHMKDWFLGQIEALKQILSQSTPLIPEIEKAYIQGCLDFQMNDKEFTNGDEQEYISNLKLDI